MIILFILLGLIAVVLAIIFISADSAPDQFSVYAETVINKPLATVFNYIKYLKYQEQYNKWVMHDPNVKRSYTGTDGTVGGITYWDSRMGQVGKGEQEITAITEGKRVDWIIRFEKPFKNEAKAFMETTAASPDATIVKWVFTGQLTYIMKVMHLLLNLKKVLTRDLTISLGNLKAVLEK